MATFLVTGGAGFIGSSLAEALLAQGDTVRILDDFSSGRRSNVEGLSGKLDLVEGSIVDDKTVSTAMQGVEVVFHEAAIPSVPRSVERPQASMLANVQGTTVVLDVARRAGVRRVVFAASSSAYGDTPTLPKVETMTAQPKSPVRRLEARRRAADGVVRRALRHRDAEPPLLQRVRPAPGPDEPVRGGHPELHHRGARGQRNQRSSATASRRATSASSTTSSAPTSSRRPRRRSCRARSSTSRAASASRSISSSASSARSRARRSKRRTHPPARATCGIRSHRSTPRATSSGTTRRWTSARASS